jgi:tetratricopeptide (TPR) repeat protein
MVTNTRNGNWKKYYKVIVATFLVLLLLPGLCFSEAESEDIQSTDEFSTLVKNLKATSDLEKRSDMCENALASGKLRREEVGMVYGFKASNYFEMAIQTYQNIADPANLSRDIRMTIDGLMFASLQSYNTAISINAGLYHNYWNRGYVYELQGKLEKALADYDKTIELNPKFIKAYFYRIRVYLEQGKEKYALEDIDRILKLDANNEKALALRQQLVKE